MKIAIIADIHANLVALDVVVADIDRFGPDQVVCLGDVAATGPQPRETLDRLRDLGWSMVLGNADAWLLDPPRDESDDEDGRRFVAIDRWCAAQLTPDDLAYLRTFRPTLEVPIDQDHTLLCFHGSSRSYNDQIVATTPEAELDQFFVGSSSAVLAGGHTHAQLLRRHRGSILLNPGSVGLPYEVVASTGRVRNPPWAEYAAVTATNRALSIELRRVPVDTRAIISASLNSGMPHAAWCAAGWS